MAVGLATAVDAGGVEGAGNLLAGPPARGHASLNNLAGLYDARGRYAEVEPLYKR